MMALLIALAAASVTLSPPKPVADLDLGKMKGEFARLAWSADGSELYLQTVERDRGGNIKAAHHYLVPASGGPAKDAGQEPAWASEYWTWKSGQSSPASKAFKIDVDQRRETKRSVAAPTGGALARGGTTTDPTAGTSFGDVAAATDASQVVTIFALKIKSDTIGEWANEAVTPGVNWSWAPAPLRFIAFTKREGGPIVVLDDGGSKQELDGPRTAILPAWSNDGKRIAWLERKDKKKYQLTVADIAAQ